MATREIKKASYSSLRKRSRRIEKLDEHIVNLVNDLIETMESTPDGIGLASPQVGVLRSIFVMNLGEEGEETKICINPELLSFSGLETDLEGCLSVPGYYGYVSRPSKVKVRYMDINGEFCEEEAEGLRARCFLHEIDHLKGIVCIDRMHHTKVWDQSKAKFVSFNIPYDLRELKEDELYGFDSEVLKESLRLAMHSSED